VIRLEATQIPNLKSNRVNLLPQLKGTGLVYDSLITYNLDPEFKALAQEMSTNIPRVATEFSTFLEHFSGYTVYVNELREKYSIENFEMQEVDKQAWIVERFEATDKYTTTINNYYNSNLNKGRSPTTPITESDTVATKYQALTDTLQSTFAMQSVYQNVFSDTHYDLDTQSFIVDDKNALESKLAEYFNSDTNTIDEKLYLAKVMHMQQGGLEFEIDTILKSINNDITKELARKDVALQKYTTIKTNTNHHRTSSTCQEYFASIKKHFCTITCQDDSWHVVKNNQNYKPHTKAA